MIPAKKPCPCGRCNKVLLEPITNCSADSSIEPETADEIIETYKDAERLRFLLANPALFATLRFAPAPQRRDWIDNQMTKPGRKKP